MRWQILTAWRISETEKNLSDYNQKIKPMYVKAYYLVLFLLLFSKYDVFSQGFTGEQIAKANTAANSDYLTEEEKKTILYMNLARMDGKAFYDEYIKEFITLNNIKYVDLENDNPYLISLKKDLSETSNLPLLKPDYKLFKASEFHANDMGNAGVTGHKSSSGESFAKRVRKYNNRRYTAIAENCSYGFDSALGITGQLLVDEGVPSLGHRNNILNPNYKYVGVAIREHKKYGYNCVMDFSSGESK